MLSMLKPSIIFFISCDYITYNYNIYDHTIIDITSSLCIILFI